MWMPQYVALQRIFCCEKCTIEGQLGGNGPVMSGARFSTIKALLCAQDILVKEHTGMHSFYLHMIAATSMRFINSRNFTNSRLLRKYLVRRWLRLPSSR